MTPDEFIGRFHAEGRPIESMREPARVDAGPEREFRFARAYDYVRAVEPEVAAEARACHVPEIPPTALARGSLAFSSQLEKAGEARRTRAPAFTRELISSLGAMGADDVFHAGFIP